MSTYNKLTKNPITQEWQEATWIDDFYGKHQYGVRFPDGQTFREEDIDPMNQNPNTNKEECPMKGRMCQCSAKENCIHIDKNKEEVCPCDDGAKVVKQHLEGCKYFYPSPQSPLSEKECNCTISPRNVHYKDCPLVAPSSNEDWMIKFYEQFGANKIWVTPSRDNVQTIFEIENFIRQQRLGAQRELTEEIINYMEDGLDEPTDWYVSVKNFLSSRGLLPKITE